MYAEAETSNEKPNMKRQNTLHEFVKKKSVQEEVAKIVSVDGSNFNRIANTGSSFIQQRFKKYNCDKAPLRNSVSARSMVLKFAAKKGEDLHRYVKNEFKSGSDFL